MFNVCYHCSLYRADKIIDPGGPYAVCPECGWQHPFRCLPLMVVPGASGSGKTSICSNLAGQYQDAVLLDFDILWRPEFNTPETNYLDYFETWLRVSKNIAQSGKPVVLFGTGLGVPDNLENCVERRYFSVIHYLALVCSDEILRKRLEQRPEWRFTKVASFMDEQIRFNQWFLNYNMEDKLPPISIIDTSHKTIEEAVKAVDEWIKKSKNNMKKIWPFSFYFLYFAAIATYAPYMVLYYRNLEFSGAQIGTLTGITPLIALLSVPLWTGIADRTNRHKLVMSLCMLVGIACLFILPSLKTFTMVLSLAVLSTFFSRQSQPLQTTLL